MALAAVACVGEPLHHLEDLEAHWAATPLRPSCRADPASLMPSCARAWGRPAQVCGSGAYAERALGGPAEPASADPVGAPGGSRPMLLGPQPGSEAAQRAGLPRPSEPAQLQHRAGTPGERPSHSTRLASAPRVTSHNPRQLVTPGPRVRFSSTEATRTPVLLRRPGAHRHRTRSGQTPRQSSTVATGRSVRPASRRCRGRVPPLAPRSGLARARASTSQAGHGAQPTTTARRGRAARAAELLLHRPPRPSSSTSRARAWLPHWSPPSHNSRRQLVLSALRRRQRPGQRGRGRAGDHHRRRGPLGRRTPRPAEPEAAARGPATPRSCGSTSATRNVSTHHQRARYLLHVRHRSASPTDHARPVRETAQRRPELNEAALWPPRRTYGRPSRGAGCPTTRVRPGSAPDVWPDFCPDLCPDSAPDRPADCSALTGRTTAPVAPASAGAPCWAGRSAGAVARIGSDSTRTPGAQLGQHGVGRALDPGGGRLDAGGPGQVAYVADLLAGHQRDHGAGVARARRTAGSGGRPCAPRAAWTDQGDVVDVDAAGRDVGGDQGRRPCRSGRPPCCGCERPGRGCRAARQWGRRSC